MSSGGYVQTFRKKCVKTRKKIEDSLFERASSEDIVSSSNGMDQEEIIITNHKFSSKQSRNGNPNSYMGIPLPPPIFTTQSVTVETHMFPIPTTPEIDDDTFVEKLNPDCDWEFELDPLPEKDFDCNDHFKWVISPPENEKCDKNQEPQEEISTTPFPFKKGEASSNSSTSTSSTTSSRCSQIINSLKSRLNSPPKHIQDSQLEPKNLIFSTQSYSGHDNSNSFIFLDNVHNNNPNSPEKLQDNQAKNENESADYDDDDEIIVNSAQPQPQTFKNVRNEHHYVNNHSNSMVSIPQQDNSENHSAPVSLRPRSIAAFTLDVDYDAITSLDIPNTEDEEVAGAKSNENSKVNSFHEQHNDFYASFSGLANIIGCIPRVCLSNKAAMQLRSQKREMEQCHCHCNQHQRHPNFPLQQPCIKNSGWLNKRNGENFAVISPYQEHRDQHEDDYSSDKFNKYYGQYSLTGINIPNANLDKGSKNGRKSSEELLLDRYHNHVHRTKQGKPSSGNIFKRKEETSSSRNLWENISRSHSANNVNNSKISNPKTVSTRANPIEDYDNDKRLQLPKSRLTKLKSLARNKWGKEQIVKRFQDDDDAGFSSSSSSSSTSLSGTSTCLKPKPKTKHRPKNQTSVHVQSSVLEDHGSNSDEISTSKRKRRFKPCYKFQKNVNNNVRSSSTSSLPVSSICEDEVCEKNDKHKLSKQVDLLKGKNISSNSKRHRVRWRFPTSKNSKKNVKVQVSNRSSVSSSDSSTSSSAGCDDDIKNKSKRSKGSARLAQEKTRVSDKKKHKIVRRTSEAGGGVNSTLLMSTRTLSINEDSIAAIPPVFSEAIQPSLLTSPVKSALSSSAPRIPVKSNTSFRVFNASSIPSSSRSDASSSSFRSNSSSGYASTFSTRTSFFLKSLRKRFIKTSNKVAVGDWEDEDVDQSLLNYNDVGRSLQGQNVICTCKRTTSRSRSKQREFIPQRKKSFSETRRASNPPVPPVFYIQPDIENISNVEKVFVTMGFDEVVLDLKSGEVKKACDGSLLFTTGPLCITSKKKGRNVKQKEKCVKLPSKSKKKREKSVEPDYDESDRDGIKCKGNNNACLYQSDAEEEKLSI
ncbi:unnamed protein product [Orchesella dallaii]|uniref:Uncharacterized protein n=1 Tax=Orchesella dallaii TaxID=48710 RepID=A0ABP1RLH0_9HEXA